MIGMVVLRGIIMVVLVAAEAPGVGFGVDVAEGSEVGVVEAEGLVEDMEVGATEGTSNHFCIYCTV